MRSAQWGWGREVSTTDKMLTQLQGRKKNNTINNTTSEDVDVAMEPMSSKA